MINLSKILGQNSSALDAVCVGRKTVPRTRVRMTAFILTWSLRPTAVPGANIIGPEITALTLTRMIANGQSLLTGLLLLAKEPILAQATKRHLMILLRVSKLPTILVV